MSKYEPTHIRESMSETKKLYVVILSRNATSIKNAEPTLERTFESLPLLQIHLWKSQWKPKGIYFSLETSIKSNGHLLTEKNMFSQSYSQKRNKGLEKVAESCFLSCFLDFSSTLWSKIANRVYICEVKLNTYPIM